MCTDCFDDPADEPAIAPEELVWLARRIEEQMSGAPVSPRGWEVYFGQLSGALDWRTLERIGRAMDGARLVASLAVARDGEVRP